MKDLLQLNPEVADALGQRRPVVALESTLIAHGLPWPMNLETARQAETAVRDEGGIPATIAVVRDEKPVTNPPGDFRLVPGDLLILVGTHAQIDRAFEFLSITE